MKKPSSQRVYKIITTLILVATATASGIAHLNSPRSVQNRPKFSFRVRTITAGVNLKNTNDTATLQSAIDIVMRAKQKFEAAGYEVQTVRIATQALPEYLGGKSRDAALPDLKALDDIVTAKGVLLSIGPVITDDRLDTDFPSWAARLVGETKNILFSVTVASEKGVHAKTALTAAEAIVALSKSTAGGEGNFRFTTSANCLPNTPFFPAGFHQGPPSLAIGLETPNLLKEAFTGASSIDEAKANLKKTLETAFAPIEKMGTDIAKAEKLDYSGIDVSPAPGKDASIGSAIEALSHVPFGNPSTLMACAAITDVLKNLNIKRCGYSGLMLPVLEDPVLATRAAEKRFTVRELLLYSTVCGTGLDVVPLPGDSSAESLAALITDVAALSTKLNRKPLSARLFPIPGKKAGDIAKFVNPSLTDSIVMGID